MKIARFKHNSKTEHGIVEGDKIRLLSGSIFDENIRIKSERVDINEVNLIHPVSPSKVICVGLNYRGHARELKMPIPDEPVIFLKPPTSVIGPGDDIIYPQGVRRLDHEAELAIVIKRRARKISYNQADEYILGYVCLNDITARDLQEKDGQWTRAKSFDTFCPIGPYICDEIDPDDAEIRLSVNGKLRQSSNTSDLIFPVRYLVSFVSFVMTLLPGDIIATGTPKGVGPLSRGDEVDLNIESIGSLVNRVV
ncbi:MAG: fumarylacetoacetate hydrolase family protein [Candidatus Omnitrophota bacterium]